MRKHVLKSFDMVKQMGETTNGSVWTTSAQKTNTFGKGRIQNVQPLENGAGIAVTRARYVTPRGRDLHGVGIIPNFKPVNQCEAWRSSTLH